MTSLRSPVRWVGGKHHLAVRILATFPPHHIYDTYLEPFCGGAHVLLAKPPYHHAEVCNDANNDLINFWMCMRDHLPEMQHKLETLPYSRYLYYEYHRSLFDGTALDACERAARWFYVLGSSFRAEVSTTPNGWNSGLHGEARAAKNAVVLFSQLATRMKYVHFDNRDFEGVIKQYGSPRTLIYCDPPYLDAEHYYQGGFNLEDHKRLATILNNTPSKVALSYYPHPLLDELYPMTKWRRITWKTPKHSQRTKETHDIATEMLLCNYPAETATLWNDTSLLASEISHWGMSESGQDMNRHVG